MVKLQEGNNMNSQPGVTFREKKLLLGLSLSGVFFLLFPLARPFFDETTLAGAMQFASGRWVLAHSLGIFGLILMPVGFLGLYFFFKETDAEKPAFYALMTNLVGAGLTLPFFGAEAFSLQVIGHAAVTMNDSGLVPLVNQVRFGPGLYFIGIGLILMSISTIIIARASWISGRMPKWTGIPLAVGFVLFMPLLQGDPAFQWIRIADGFLILVGCYLLARKAGKPGKAN
jgi:hypothetical protein